MLYSIWQKQVYFLMLQIFSLCQLPINFNYADFVEQKSKHDGYFNKGDNNGGEEKWTDLENILVSGKLEVENQIKQDIKNDF